MAEWVPLTETTDYTLSSTEITLVGVTPDADSAYDVHYSYADASAEGGHQHTLEQRDGSWNDGQTWSLAHRPDGHEFLLMRQQTNGLVWQFTSDFGATTNQQLRLYELTGPAASLSWAVTDGPWSVPAGETITTVQALTAQHVFFGTIRNGGPTRIYRFDRSDGSFNVIYSYTHTPSKTAPRVFQIVMESESDIYLILAKGHVDLAADHGIYHTTDGGTNWTHLAGFAETGSLNDSFVEQPNQPYSLVKVASRLYTLHTGFESGGGASRWNISHSDDGGSTWAKDTGTISQFHKGAPGFLYSIGVHLPYTSLDFLAYSSGDVGFHGAGPTGGGDASTHWLAVFSDGTMLTRGSSPNSGRISTDYGLTWANAPAATAPAGTTITDCDHIVNVWQDRDWLIVPAGSAQSQNITTDKGTTWQTLALPNWCGLAAFVGGVG